MENVSEAFYVCRACAEGMTLEELRAYRPVVTVDGNVTRWDCPDCGKNILISIDGGTLDLGLVRDEVLTTPETTENKFEMLRRILE